MSSSGEKTQRHKPNAIKCYREEEAEAAHLLPLISQISPPILMWTGTGALRIITILIKAQFKAVVENSLIPINNSICLIILVCRHELFDFRSVIAIVEVCDLVNPFLLNFCVASTCNFAAPPPLSEVAGLISEEGAQRSYYI